MITRVAAGVVGLAVLVPILVFGGPWALEAVALVALGICADEYRRMAFPGDPWSLAPLLLGAGAVFLGLVHLDARWHALLGLAVVAGTLSLGVFRPGPDLARAADRTGRLLVGVGWIGGGAAALTLLRGLPSGLAWVFLALALSWLGDTGGFFAGKYLGRHKLYPRISPKKTWEGLAGGLALATAGAFAIRAVGLPQLGALDCVVLGVGVGSVATVGDLAESMLKRSFDVKDSGTILPGHGGLLDRIDSVLFVAPALLAWALLAVGPA